MKIDENGVKKAAPLLWGLAALSVATPSLLHTALSDLRAEDVAQGAWALQRLQVQCPALEERLQEAVKAPEAKSCRISLHI